MASPERFQSKWHRKLPDCGLALTVANGVLDRISAIFLLARLLDDNMEVVPHCLGNKSFFGVLLIRVCHTVLLRLPTVVAITM